MTLSPGAELGPYEIISLAGSGGMGEVYRAKDKRLNRIVAIKVLPSHLSSNSDLKQRFEREAKAISNLNHPHICTLYDVGQQNGMEFLIMEYLDGETLASRLKKSALPLEQTLTLSVQIADALDKAHRAGIIHRDLKPGNIMITKSGVKLLDFGLAKFQAAGPDQIVAGLSGLATQEKDLTAEGTILGTLQYMSPEQLEGKATDARTDIFAFGSVIYEMLTGKKAFEGKSQASLIAAILEKNPVPMNEIQPMTPPILDRIVRKCLEKDPDQRWQSAADLASELKWVSEGSLQSQLPTATARKNILPWVIAICIAIAGAFAINYLMFMFRTSPQIDSQVIHGDLNVDMESPVVPGWGSRMVISPDGKILAYIGSSSNQRSDLYIRRLDQSASQKLDGTEGVQYSFFSPDSKWIGFFAGGKLKKIPVGGGTAITLYENLINSRGGAWGPNNTIVFSESPISGLKSVDANSGEVKTITNVDPKKMERSHRWPQFLPDGKAILFTAQYGISSFDTASIEAIVISTGKRYSIYKGGSNAKYVRGQLIFCQKGILYAAPFDEKTLQLKSKPVPVLEGVVYDERSGGTQYTLSDSGTLVYQAGGSLFSDGKLIWVDSNGKVSPLVDQNGSYLNLRISPDGEKLAMQIGDVLREDIWIYHFKRGSFTRLTFNEGQDVAPVWTPDGQRITYSSWRKNNKPFIYEIRADGSGKEEILYQPPEQQWIAYQPNSWSPDGRYLTISGTSDKTELRSEIFIFDRNTGKAEPFFTSLSTNDRDASFSPNGRWIAYSSGDVGISRVYVRAFGKSGLWQVSPDLGFGARWSKDGTQLFFQEWGPPSKWFVVDVNPSSESFDAGQPRMLFQSDYTYGPFLVAYDVHPDGKRFVIWQPATLTVTKHLQFISNWVTELQKSPK